MLWCQHPACLSVSRQGSDSHIRSAVTVQIGEMSEKLGDTRVLIVDDDPFTRTVLKVVVDVPVHEWCTNRVLRGGVGGVCLIVL